MEEAFQAKSERRGGSLPRSQWGKHLRQSYEEEQKFGRIGGGYGEGENGLQLASLEERDKAEAVRRGTET